MLANRPCAEFKNRKQTAPKPTTHVSPRARVPDTPSPAVRFADAAVRAAHLGYLTSRQTDRIASGRLLLPSLPPSSRYYYRRYFVTRPITTLQSTQTTTTTTWFVIFVFFFFYIREYYTRARKLQASPVTGVDRRKSYVSRETCARLRAASGDRKNFFFRIIFLFSGIKPYERSSVHACLCVHL